MFHNTMVRKFKRALDALADAEPLGEVLTKLSMHNANLQARVREIADGSGNKIADNANAMHSDIASLPTITRQFSTRSIFRQIERLSTGIEEAFNVQADDKTFITTILDELDAFAELYNEYVTHPTGPRAHALLVASSQLNENRLLLEQYLKYVYVSMHNNTEHSEFESQFSLAWVYVGGLRDVANKLNALQDLYDELATMLDVTVATSPLRISKIESGSLLTELFGDTRVVGLMVKFIESSAKYIHRNFTNEGKISAIPGKVQSLEAILNLSDRLKASGADVSALEATLTKNAVTIAHSLSSLLADQPSVEVNGVVISAGEEMQRALLKQTSIKQLGYSPQSTLGSKVDGSQLNES